MQRQLQRQQSLHTDEFRHQCNGKLPWPVSQKTKNSIWEVRTAAKGEDVVQPFRV